MREGPIALITTTTGELYSENETRMLSWHIHEDREQTAAVMTGLPIALSALSLHPIDLACGMISALDRARSERCSHSICSADYGCDQAVDGALSPRRWLALLPSSRQAHFSIRRNGK